MWNKYDYIGFSDVTSYTDTNREYGEDVSYKIETVDTEGLVSEEGTILNTKTYGAKKSGSFHACYIIK